MAMLLMLIVIIIITTIKRQDAFSDGGYCDKCYRSVVCPSVSVSACNAHC